jgi:hypothetical protein
MTAKSSLEDKLNLGRSMTRIDQSPSALSFDGDSEKISGLMAQLKYLPTNIRMNL